MIWAAMRELGEFTLGQLAEQAQQEYGTVHKYVDALKRVDYVGCLRARAPHETHESSQYKLLMNTGPQPPAPKGESIQDPNLDISVMDGLTRCWLAMRQTKTFDSPTLQALAELKQRTIETYLTKFLQAQYIAVVSKRQSGHIAGWRTYRLVRDTGPLAPVFRADGSVFDANERREIALPEQQKGFAGTKPSNQRRS